MAEFIPPPIDQLIAGQPARVISNSRQLIETQEDLQGRNADARSDVHAGAAELLALVERRR